MNVKEKLDRISELEENYKVLGVKVSSLEGDVIDPNTAIDAVLSLLNRVADIQEGRVKITSVPTYDERHNEKWWFRILFRLKNV